MSFALVERVGSLIRSVPDFPKPGILFRDITPLLLEPETMKHVVDWFCDDAVKRGASKIVAIESRGFLFASAMSHRLSLPLALARKEGKLPYETCSCSYELEYGQAVLQMHTDAVAAGDRVVVVDDVLATGGTASAVVNLVESLGGAIVGAQFLMELSFLNGRHRLKCPSMSLITF